MRVVDVETQVTVIARNSQSNKDDMRVVDVEKGGANKNKK